MALPDDIALEGSHDFAFAPAFGDLAFDIFAGGFVGAHSCQRDGVNGPVQATVSAAIEPVPDRVSRGRRDRAGASDHRECGFGSDASWVRPDGHEDRGRYRAYAVHRQR